MQVRPSIETPQRRPPRSGRKDQGFWKNRADEVREVLLLMNQERLEDAGKVLKNIGSGLKGAWNQVKDAPSRLFHLPILDGKVDEQQQKKWLQLAESVGLTLGFVAAGGHALGGALKIASGHQQRDNSRKLDGIVDIATAATLTATVAGFGGARAVLAPLAAALNIYRGGHNSGHGFKTHNGREQLQGALDAVRSAGSIGRLLKTQAAFFQVAGIALAPIAGTLQAGRGLHDISIGLKNSDNKKELDGLADIATAVGTALAFASGAAVIPGVALAVAASIAKITYQLSPKARKKMDPWIDKLEPKLERAVAQVDKFTEPVRKAWRAVMSRLVKNVDHEAPQRFSKSELAEITHLLFADGDYNRQEERRLKVTLEQSGQVNELPGRQNPAPKRDRRTLCRELQTIEQRREFLNFLFTVASYDHASTPEEENYIQELSHALEIPNSVVLEIRASLVPPLSISY